MSIPTPSPAIEDLLRQLAPQVISIMTRRHGQFDAAEDAVQEALLAATRQWPDEGIPENPRGWLITVAERRLADFWRSEQARRRRETTVTILDPEAESMSPDPGDDRPQDRDDTLTLLFLCCHPALTPASQIALTLRAVGGLTTGEIARAFFVPESTMGQRISRAKQRIRATGATFSMPPAAERPERLKTVLHVLYLIFNEGYTTTSGPDLLQTGLTSEAIRLTRLLHQLLPDHGEITGLLALMLLTDARRPARTGPDGSLIPLAEQDRTLWRHDLIEEGVALVEHALTHAALGPYQLQAAIAAIHDEAPAADQTDWPQIVALYRLHDAIAPNPMATLNHAVAVAMVDGPQAGLVMLQGIEQDDRLREHHRLESVRAHLLEMAGETTAARKTYLLAARHTTSLPEQRYLLKRANQLR